MSKTGEEILRERATQDLRNSLKYLQVVRQERVECNLPTVRVDRAIARRVAELTRRGE